MATVAEEKHDQDQGAQHRSVEEKHRSVNVCAFYYLCCPFTLDIVVGLLKPVSYPEDPE